MELANLWDAAGADMEHVRMAKRSDMNAIMQLLQNNSHSHAHMDWNLPGDWLGSEGFVVYPAEKGHVNRLWGWRPRLEGCLAVAADPPPAAWVRVAAVVNQERPQLVLAAMLAQVIPFLRQTAVTQLGWLAVNDWPDSWLPALGFFRLNQIETYEKTITNLSPVRSVPNLHIRPARQEDMVALAQIEAAAFAPLWRHSAQALRLALPQAFSFDVVLLNDQLVGFQVSTRSSATHAHLARMTIHPKTQGTGVGSALLIHTLSSYQQKGIQRVSLNTQIDNFASQKLYRKFGFYTTGERLPIWCLNL